MVTLTLGGVVFADFEVPENINFGGQQMLNVHKLPGGTRVIDDMGPDDDDIRWSGRFRGSSAEQRALLLDYMRRQGKPVLLTWSLHRFQVVIHEFKPDFRQSYEIPYSISCTVLLDEAQAIASAAIGFVESMASDMVNALGLSGVISDNTVKTGVAAVATAFSNYQAGVPNTTNAIAGASALAEGPLLNGLQASIADASSAVKTAIGAISFNTTPVAAGSPSTMAQSLTTAANSLGSLSNLYQIASVIGRMGVNTANARA
jgi:hypothetical protein